MNEAATFDEILKRMLDRIPNDMDKREGSIIYDAIAPAAIELQLMYLELGRVIDDGFADTATRDALIRRAAERGLSPKPATYAQLKAAVTPSDVDIPTGSRFSLNGLYYTVISKESNGEYTLMCEASGSAGNQYYGDLIPIDYIQGLESVKIAELEIPGEDEEETEIFRRRYFDSFEPSSFGGNVRDYVEKINAIPGVGGVKIVRVWNNGLKPAELVPNSEVTAWYESYIAEAQEPVKTWLERVFTGASEKLLTTGGTVGAYIINSNFDVPSAALTENVQTQLDPVQNAGEGVGIAPIGHVVAIKAVNGVEVCVKTDLSFESGLSWADLQDQIDAAISDYLLELRKSWSESEHISVRVSRIEAGLLGIDGVIDVTNTSINGKRENLILGEFDVPVFGGCSS